MEEGGALIATPAGRWKTVLPAAGSGVVHGAHEVQANVVVGGAGVCLQDGNYFGLLQFDDSSVWSHPTSSLVLKLVHNAAFWLYGS